MTQTTRHRCRLGRLKHRVSLFLCGCTLWLICGWMPTRAQGQPNRSQTHPADLMPEGLLVYLEVRDLQQTLSRWNDSQEKKQWLESANYAQFKNSKIYLKLTSRLEQFSRSAGFSIDYRKLSKYAGRRSALGLYNPSEVQFLFLTELTATERKATDLIRLKGRFESRQVAGMTYFINQSGGRTVCYAETAPFFLLATHENLLKAALSLQKQSGSVRALSSNSAWREMSENLTFHDATIYLPLDALTANSNFKREWLFGNIRSLSQFKAAGMDLEWQPNEIKEQRVFIRKHSPSADRALAPSLVERFVPNGMEYVAAVSNLTGDSIARQVESSLFNPLPSSDAAASRSRPLYGSYRGYPQSRPRSAYERRIDDPELPEAPDRNQAAEKVSLLFKRLSEAGSGVAVEIGRTRKTEEGVFLHFDQAFVLPIDPARLTPGQIRQMIETEYRELYTAGGFGSNWSRRTLAGIPYEMFTSGSLRVAWAQIEGNLVLTSPPAIMVRIIQTHQARLPARFDLGSGGGNLVYFSAVDVQSVRPGFEKLMAILDYSERQARRGGGPPLFFSQNLVSLLETFSRLKRVTIRRHAQGSRVLETVTYQLQP